MGNFLACFHHDKHTDSSVNISTGYNDSRSEVAKVQTPTKRLSPKRVESLTDVLGKVKLDHGDVEKKKKSISRLPELPDETEELCERAWNKNDDLSEVFVKEFNIPITRKDLQTLYYHQWLNDEVINFYFNLIYERSKMSPNFPKIHAFNTYFYSSYSSRGFAGVRRWTRNMNIFENEFILFPLHLNEVHWCLIAVDLKQKRIGFFDSMGTDGHNHVCKILDYLKHESEEKHGSKYNLDEFEFIHKAKAPKQHNGCDCGVFTCQFGEYISRRAKLDFSQSDIDYFRERMVYEIVNKTLLL